MTMLVRGGAVTGSALPATATTGQVLQWNGSAWVAATPSASGTTPNATTTVPGLVQLAGDLGGTAAAPTVPALTGKADKTALATVATSGAYTDLTGRPALATVATSGSYGDLTGRPLLATVATTGAYADLIGTPTVPTQYLRVKTTNTTTTGSTYLNDPDLQVANLPVGTYAWEFHLTAASTAAAQTGWSTNAPAGMSGGTSGVYSGNQIGGLTNLSTFLYANTGQRASQSGSLVVTTAGLFALTYASNTAGSLAGFGPGSWLRLTKLA